MDIQETNRKVIEQFRAGGEVEGLHRERLLLLTTTGAKSGQQRTTPMMFHREEDRLLVIASNMGSPNDPDWCANLRADPHVTVEVGDERYAALAHPLEGDERQLVWARIKEANPFFADHEAKVIRAIPVVDLVRAEG